MDTNKKNSICEIIDTGIRCFAEGLELKHGSEVNNPDGVINSKKNNCFIAELGNEFMFYSAFVRSFDSSFGKVLENLGNSIAKLSYEVKGSIESFILPEQNQHIANLMNSYNNHAKPELSHYNNFKCIIPKNIASFERTHQTDNYFYDKNTGRHFIIELKAGGDLDNKKARAEKESMLTEYFLLKNKLADTKEEVYLYFATAYNKSGEGNKWKQERVLQYFSEDELLIGKNYWNFVCNDIDGFYIVFEQYKKSAEHIRKTLNNIKSAYFEKGSI